jgi:DNA polymerase-3 subunit epsilon/ATP-dependent DNA helicase DinG
LSRILVSLDLETTGLDPLREAIIEIGAVKFRGDEVLDTFSTLINPARSIPPKITDLTGIADRDVVAAPRLFDVLPRLSSFVRDLTIVGHNIAFDLGFLNRQRVLQDNLSIDTFELAGMLIPHAERYNLGALAREVGITLPATHRALDDARVTQALYMKMFERACDIPLKTLEEIVKHADQTNWPLQIFFADALKASSRGAFSAGSIGAQLKAKGLAPKGQAPIFQPKPADKPLRPASETEALDTDALAALLESDGAFDKAFPQFEHRAPQVQMLRAVSNAFNAGQHLLVEAGTGTGKSLAYLLPALHWAAQNGRRVVVSTNTINLQEQLATKDVPDLQKVLPFEFRAAVLKGRSHYLCPARLQQMRRQDPTTIDELRVLVKVLLWLPSTVNGDGDELFIPTPAERAAWGRLSAESEACTSERCAATNCFFHRARQAAESAHVLIVNHALLLADVAVANRALPEYDYLIIDEAHHLEDAATDQLSFSISRAQLKRTLQELGRLERAKADGVLADVMGRIRSRAPAQVADKVEPIAAGIAAGIDRAVPFAEELFDLLIDFAREHVEGKSDYMQRVRLTPGLRAQPAWSNIEIAWDNLSAPLVNVSNGLAQMYKALQELEEYDIPDYDEVKARVSAYARSSEETRGHMAAILTKPLAGEVYWIEIEDNRSGRGGERTLLNLNSAPLHVGPLIQQHLWNTKEAVVLTSATLRTAKSFNYIRSRLSADEMNELAVGSPFDYKSSTLLYLVTDIPEPGQPGFQQALDRGLTMLAIAMRGRTLALFTSYASLRATSKGITAALNQSDILVYEQGDGSSRRQLMESFKKAERAVLLGTRSFWEGVDVPGEALSCLALTRLPFAVPTDPIFAARSETFDEPFTQYSVPDAILKFRQGFGRLIRTKTDRGVVAVFDKRVLTKQYGQLFLQSLPDCTVRRGPASDLAKAAAVWMNGTGQNP